MTRTRSIGLIGVLAGLSVLPASLPATSSAATYTFGSNLPPPTPGYYDSCSETCTTAQIALPGAEVRSPVSGTVVRFRLRTAAGSDPHKIKFRILRSVDGVKFTGVGTSRAFDIPTTEGITTFDVNLPIRKGDYIGIDLPAGGKQARVIATNNGAFQGAWFPALGDNVTPKRSDNAQGSTPTVFDLLLQADVDPQPTDCTNNKSVATCADTDGLPAMCGPTTLGFPQCSLPFDLPTACSGTGTGFPVCNLPGNQIVACGGFGLNLPVCKLPPKQVPGVCGPVTLGFQPCTISNNQVTACGPVSLGLSACNFKTQIKGRAPIEPDGDGGEVETTVSCPPEAKGSDDDCSADVQLASAIKAHRSALRELAYRLSSYYSEAWQYYPESYWAIPLADVKEYAANNAVVYYLTRAGAILAANEFPFRGRTQIAPLSKDERFAYRLGIYSIQGIDGPDELWQNYWTEIARDYFVDAVGAAISELRQLAAGGSGSAAAAAAKAKAPRPARPLFKDHYQVPRGKRKSRRLHIELSRKAVRRLVKGVPKKTKVVPVRLVVSFRAKPRPIVRFVDFGLKIKR